MIVYTGLWTRVCTIQPNNRFQREAVVTPLEALIQRSLQEHLKISARVIFIPRIGVFFCSVFWGNTTYTPLDFPPFDHYLTGTLVPVSALRSAESCGVGEYLDLIDFGAWCQDASLDLIQLLPINDTGHNNSPYAALSAFALHPIHIRLQALPGADAFHEEIASFREVTEQHQRLAYLKVLYFKNDLLWRLFEANEADTDQQASVDAWIVENPWATPYAAFRTIKDQHEQRSWVDWQAWQTPTAADIEWCWATYPRETRFYAWVQYHAEKQFRTAVEDLANRGIALKGDLPILMSDDSADVWLHREYFNLAMRAGAPPDMFSAHGQNWGFPTYHWKQLADDDYAWWRQRLQQAAKFYHAYRIDHVLGFFRIWQVPEHEHSGLLGHFNPSLVLTREDLHALGFDDARIHWLTDPHLHPNAVWEATGDHAPHVFAAYLDQIGNESLFTLKPHLHSEKAIQALDEADPVKDFLQAWHRNRTLLALPEGTFAPHWTCDQTNAFHSLAAHEQQALRQLIDTNRAQNEHIWADHGRALLQMMRETTSMLTCAEDLGVVPDCVPDVLAELEILGLKVERWSRDYDQPDAPMQDPQSYPLLSVCIPSVHDSSTLRGWWLELGDERGRYAERLGWPAEAVPETLTPELARAILRRNLDAASLLTVFQLQDLFALEPSLQLEDPNAERCNVPGTVADTNWTYRLPVSLSTLKAHTAFTTDLADVIAERRHRSLTLPQP